MSGAYIKHDEGDREVGKTGEILQVDGDWQLENHNNDDGPVIWHNCGNYTVDLNRRFTMCRECGADTPLSMISGFTLLNFNKANDSEYFIPTEEEVIDFVYNGHLRSQLEEATGKEVGLWTCEDIDTNIVLAVIDKWKKEQELT